MVELRELEEAQSQVIIILIPWKYVCLTGSASSSPVLDGLAVGCFGFYVGGQEKDVQLLKKIEMVWGHIMGSLGSVGLTTALYDGGGSRQVRIHSSAGRSVNCLLCF